MSLSVFNGLLYGGDMAPDVKQDGAAVEDTRDEVFRLTARATHMAVNGQPVWQTPEPLTLLLDAAETIAKLSHRLLDEKEKTRFWRYAYLTVSALYVVVLIAAVWGWTR